jgi:hypothetical protein
MSRVLRGLACKLALRVHTMESATVRPTPTGGVVVHYAACGCTEYFPRSRAGSSSRRDVSSVRRAASWGDGLGMPQVGPILDSNLGKSTIAHPRPRCSYGYDVSNRREYDATLGEGWNV